MDGQVANGEASYIPTSGSGLDIRIERVDSKTVRVRVAGELDLATSIELEGRLDEIITDGHRTEMILDLSELSFLDSTGLRALWTARQHALAHGGTLVLDEPSDPVLRVLRMTKLDKIFQVQLVQDAADDIA